MASFPSHFAVARQANHTTRSVFARIGGATGLFFTGFSDTGSPSDHTTRATLVRNPLTLWPPSSSRERGIQSPSNQSYNLIRLTRLNRHSDNRVVGPPGLVFKNRYDCRPPLSPVNRERKDVRGEPSSCENRRANRVDQHNRTRTRPIPQGERRLSHSCQDQPTG